MAHPAVGTEVQAEVCLEIHTVHHLEACLAAHPEACTAAHRLVVPMVDILEARLPALIPVCMGGLLLPDQEEDWRYKER